MTSLLLLLVVACSEYDLRPPQETVDDPDTDVDTDIDVTDPGGDVIPSDEDPLDEWDGSCEHLDEPPIQVALTDACDDLGIGGFEPTVEWTLGSGLYSRATVAVGDLDGDDVPEVVANLTGLFGRGDLVVAHGDGSGTLWTRSANLGYASSPALADLDRDGAPEILVVREYASSLLAAGDYTVVAWNADGTQRWESDHFEGLDFDYATAVHVSDMDHDGLPEVVAGRVILNHDGTTRGVGAHGRGSEGVFSFGGISASEGSVSAVADLDLDGVEEVITGDAMYGPDGQTLWHNGTYNDGMVAVGNLDADPEGEFVAVTGNTVRALDTDGSLMWGPLTIESANLMSPPAIADVDVDGEANVLVAGGNSLWALRADGTVLWEAAVTDMTGASGASVFDFEGDGYPEVVYIDEVEMFAFDGATGAVKFHSTDHASDTMYDYPVIADVDGDGHAEIVVAHAGSSVAISVYGDAANSWAPARQVWNQHAYCITNVNDDLTVPVYATPGFQAYNRWHSGIDRPVGEGLVHDVEVEVLGVCEDDCDVGSLFLYGRVLNRSSEVVPAGLHVTLYARLGNLFVPVDARTTTSSIPSGWSGTVMTFEVDAATAAAASALRLRADDNGAGTGSLAECDEVNNTAVLGGSFCNP